MGDSPPRAGKPPVSHGHPRHGQALVLQGSHVRIHGGVRTPGG